MGAGLGALWYIWYYQIWTCNSRSSKFVEHIFGYGLYSMAVSIILLNPRWGMRGFYIGAFIGKIIIFELCLGFANWTNTCMQFSKNR